MLQREQQERERERSIQKVVQREINTIENTAQLGAIKQYL
jgi:hypothetical protein